LGIHNGLTEGGSMSIAEVGPLCFGAVVGWITYRTLRRKTEATALSDISAVIAAVGGGAVVAIFKGEALFGWYSVGLAVGFFLYFLIALLLSGKKVETFMGE
jgi:hypothetical protein